MLFRGGHRGRPQVTQFRHDLFGEPHHGAPHHLDGHEVVSTALSIVGERLHVGYHYRVLRPDHEAHEEVEQHLYFQVRNGRVLSIDLICSGYRPASAIVEQRATVAAVA